MRFLALAVVLALSTVAFVPFLASAESPCGPNVQRCEPPCRTGDLRDCFPNPRDVCRYVAFSEPLPDPCAT